MCVSFLILIHFFLSPFVPFQRQHMLCIADYFILFISPTHSPVDSELRVLAMPYVHTYDVNSFQHVMSTSELLDSNSLAD